MNSSNQPKSRAEWYEQIRDYESSGLSQTEFCKQRNLIQCRFGYYRKQYKQQTDDSFVTTKEFSPVVLNQPSTLQINNIKIELPNGFRCYVPNEVSPEHLKKLLGIMLSC